MLPKKGSRRIVVRDRAYRWTLSTADHELDHLLIQIQSEEGGARLTARVAPENLVTPRFVRALVERGAELGWTEERPRTLTVDTVVAVRGERVLAQILDAVRRDQHAKALRYALDAWRRFRVPDLAEIAERIAAVVPSTREGEPFRELACSLDPIPSRLVRTALDLAEETDSAQPVALLIEHHGQDPRVPIGLYRGLVELDPNEASSDLLDLVLDACVASRDHRLVRLLKEEARSTLAPHAFGALSRLNLRVKRAATDLERCFPLGPPYLVDAGGLLDDLRIQLGLASPEPPEGTAELLTAIYDAPEEDAPRLVLADLLEQSGDPRGELIHLQIAQHRGELDDVGAQRIDRLLALHERRWLGGLNDILTGASFERGFPAEGTLDLRALLGPTEGPVGEPGLATIERMTIPYVNVESETLLGRLIALLCSGHLRNLVVLNGASTELVRALAATQGAPDIRKIRLRPVSHFDEVAVQAKALGDALSSHLPSLAELSIPSDSWPETVLDDLRSRLGPRVRVVTIRV